MNIDDAFIKLNLNKDSDIFDIKKLKNHYHFLALKYHPDKNNNYDSKIKFQEINEAYILLLNFYNSVNDNSVNDNSENGSSENGSSENINSENINSNKKSKVEQNTYISFEDLFKDFIGLLNIKDNNEIELVKKYFIDKYSYYNSLILKKLSNNNYFKNLINIFNIIDEENYEEIFIINTEIDNVLNNEIYKFELFGEILFIPLWCKELIYKKYLIKIKIINKYDFIYLIDNDNNIFINLERNINKLLDNDLIFNIGCKEFIIANNLLYMKKNYNYKLENCGIISPYCDINNIYRSNIFINLTLT